MDGQPPGADAGHGAGAPHEPPWRAGRRARGAPRVSLSREAIVDAAVAVLDRDGADGLSMRRVAQRLGAGVGSLYWHVRNKDELLQLIAERIAAEIQLPPPDPGIWQEQLKDVARQMRQGAKRHRDGARLTLGRVPWGPDLARVNEWLFELLTPVGVPDHVIAYAGDLGALYVGAFAFEESLGLASPTGEALEPKAIVAMFRDYLLSLPKERFPHVHRAIDELLAGDTEARFEFGLDVIVRGIASYAKAPPAAAAAGPRPAGN